MIILGNRPLAPEDYGSYAQSGRFVPVIFRAMATASEWFAFPTSRALNFELNMRNETIEAAYALFASDASFATFYHSECNSYYWTLTGDGGFELKPGMPAAQAIRDIFVNGEAYAFECATAMMIILYKALSGIMPDSLFNEIFQQLYLWDWKNHPFFQLRNVPHVDTGIPGDIRYFKNPDVNPQTPQWQGENAIDLSAGKYYGHGVGIMTAAEMIAELNQYRRPGAMTSAYRMNHATRPDYQALHALSEGARTDGIRVAAGTSFFTL